MFRAISFKVKYMWLLLAFFSAFFMGFYDVSKKYALIGNTVIPVLLLNTFFSSLIFLPLILFSQNGTIETSSILYVNPYDVNEQFFIFIKSLLVLLSWVFAYFGLKHLPITIVGPINATRPIWVLLGAIIFFDEKLSYFQWVGVSLAIVSFYLLSNIGKKEGIDFKHNKWIFFVIMANIIGALCGLYDKYLLASPMDKGMQLGVINLLSWYNIYQFLLMLIVWLVFWLPKYYGTSKFQWRWSIVGVSIFLSCAELFYFTSLSYEGAMISIVSMIRRSSVVVSFLLGAWLFKEKNIKNKVVDLMLMLISMIFLCID